MIVCHCYGITDHDLRKASNGPAGLNTCPKSAHAGKGCGGCKPLIQKVLASSLKRDNPGAPEAAQPERS